MPYATSASALRYVAALGGIYGDAQVWAHDRGETGVKTLSMTFLFPEEGTYGSLRLWSVRLLLDW